MPLYGQALAGSSKPAGDPAIVMGGLVLIALIAIASLGVLFRWNVINRLLVGACAVVGLIAFPLLSRRG